MDARVKIVSDQYLKSVVPHLEAGYYVEVAHKIIEGKKERIQTFKGTVIRVDKQDDSINANFTVRTIASGIGVEKVFPIHSPKIVEIKVLRAYKVRRAKLHYLRGLTGKALRMKEIPLQLRMKTNKVVAKEVAAE